MIQIISEEKSQAYFSYIWQPIAHIRFAKASFMLFDI